jgi:hypothetical protein
MYKWFNVLLSLILGELYPILSAYIMYILLLGTNSSFSMLFFHKNISNTKEYRLRRPYAVWYTGKSTWLESETPGSPIR